MSESDANADNVLQPTVVVERVNSAENLSTIPATDSKPKSKKGRKKKSDTILPDRKVFECL